MDRSVAGDLTIEVSPRGVDGVFITVGGEIDMSVTGHLRRALLSVVDPDAPTVLRLDLSSVRFCDCVGIGTLIDVRRDAEASGTGVAIAVASPAVLLLLTLFDLGSIFGFPADARFASTGRRRRWRWLGIRLRTAAHSRKSADG